MRGNSFPVLIITSSGYSTFFSSQFLGILDEHHTIKDELDYIFSFSSSLNVFIFLILTFRSIYNDFYFLFYILTYSDISFFIIEFYRPLSSSQPLPLLHLRFAVFQIYVIRFLDDIINTNKINQKLFLFFSYIGRHTLS